MEISLIDNSDTNPQLDAKDTSLNRKNGNEGDTVPAVINKTVCRFYLQKSCKNGRKGDDCKFAHPKLCFNYVKRGDERGGCKKGTNRKLPPSGNRDSSAIRHKCPRQPTPMLTWILCSINIEQKLSIYQFRKPVFQ